MLSRSVARVASRVCATRSVTCLATKVQMPMNVQVAHFSQEYSLDDMVPKATKAIKKEIADFKGDLDDCADELAAMKATVSVKADGEINMVLNVNGYKVEAVYNQEFEYDEADNDEASDQGESELESDAENYSDNENDDAENSTHHTVVSTITNPVNGSTIQVSGTLSLSGDYEVENITPLKNGVPFRKISVSDLQEDTVNGIFDVLEATALNQDYSNLLVKYARYQRISNHIESLNAINDFVSKLKA